ncbi:MerR family DNA-binding transcriptional regulator [Alteribacter natronophilus]|uniref:MerR family DNA-binding transcriptional regulator n=1 Tax=Alteribacter natronophilus TaxID=2583810 RepID=UPI00110E8232|nr:MerR family DNA-binding transcriptional regulator [Alteribacter natronophilus]TMW71416.1 MerR family DNA-binding transcriptional regulator [Alteribacter natronophilus]
MQRLKPADIARSLGVSTSTLRHYEARGFVPPAERTKSGYRVYTEEHKVWFACVTDLSDGFGMDAAVQVIRCVREDRVEEAVWFLNDLQIQRGKERSAVERARELAWLQGEPAALLKTGEAAEKMGVSSSALRYWEREGYLHPFREPESGYRGFDHLQLARVSLLLAVNHTDYTSESAELKLKFKDPAFAGKNGCLKLADEVINLLNKRNRKQIHAYASLEKLLLLLGK